MVELLNSMPLEEIIALVVLALTWMGYPIYADFFAGKRCSLMTVMKQHRVLWMYQMLERENRVVDTQIMSAIMRSVSLFSTTSIFILAGLVTILGALDKARDLVSNLPFTQTASPMMWELKLLAMMFVFVYAFFKFAWSLRQFNYTIVMIGAAPDRLDADTPKAKAYAQGAGQIVSLAVHNFNRGLRSYYFGMAMISWFVHPYLFCAMLVLVVGVLYRREFMSNTLRELDLTLRQIK
jgi:uncharacterized membrane protein